MFLIFSASIIPIIIFYYLNKTNLGHQHLPQFIPNSSQIKVSIHIHPILSLIFLSDFSHIFSLCYSKYYLVITNKINVAHQYLHQFIPNSSQLEISIPIPSILCPVILSYFSHFFCLHYSKHYLNETDFKHQYLHQFTSKSSQIEIPD